VARGELTLADGIALGVVAGVADGTEAQRFALRQLSFPRPAEVGPEWLFGLVQWTVLLAVAPAGAVITAGAGRRPDTPASGCAAR
jgi:hypothetical protein